MSHLLENRGSEVRNRYKEVFPCVCMRVEISQSVEDVVYCKCVCVMMITTKNKQCICVCI